MFTGIVIGVGEVVDLNRGNGILRMIVKVDLNGFDVGDSVAIDGACLTVVDVIDDYKIVFEVMDESVNRTLIKNYVVGSKVNIEKALKVGDSLDGHFVMGHIDFVGEVFKIDKVGNDIVIGIKVPDLYMKYFAVKGSVAVNGVSLTVTGVESDGFVVNLIPYTFENTDLSYLNVGDFVNVEIDPLARYLDVLLDKRG